MNMIGHYDACTKLIAHPGKVLKRIIDDFYKSFFLQNTATHSFIKPIFDPTGQHSPQLIYCFFTPGGRISYKPIFSNPLQVFDVVSRNRVVKPKGHKVSCPILPPMRKIADVAHQW
jgi:hypothetical protein